MNHCQCCQQAGLEPLKGNFIDYISREVFEIWRCPQCYSMETRGGFSQHVYYGGNYYGSEQGKFNPLLEKIFKANHRHNAKALYDKCRKPKTVLEIGCGRGYILRELQALGCEVQGLESADAASWILNNAELSVVGVSSGQAWPINDNSQDLVIVWHVLEHLNDPNQVLSQIYKCLKPGGTVCVSVPNCKALQARIDFASWFHLDVPRHHFHFSRVGLEQSLKRHQLEIVQYEGGELIQNLYGWWQSLANLSTRPHNNLLYRWLQGGDVWRRCPNKRLLWRQFVTLPLWLPFGLVGWLWESFSPNAGTMTLYARK